MAVVLPPVVDLADGAEQVRQDPEGFLARCRDQYGSVFTVVMAEGKRITYVLDPHVFQPLLTARQVDFSSISRQSKLRFGLGGMVETEADVRQLSTGLIRALRGRPLRQSIARFEDRMEAVVADYVASLAGEERRTIQDLAARTLIPASVHALFGEGVFDATFVDDFMAFSTSVSTRFAGSDPSLAERGEASERALMDRLERVLEVPAATPVVEQLLAGILDRPDLAREDRLRTLVMLMWGSMVNLVPSSVWMYASLLGESDLVAALRAEQVAGDQTLGASIAAETLRLFSRPNMYREVTEDFELPFADGRRVRFTAGDWVALFPRFLHHDPEVFRNALGFDATRFCPVGGKAPAFSKGGERLRQPTVVFGLGRGRCPGDGYALSVLASTLRCWTSALDARRTDDPLPPAVNETVASTPGPASEVFLWVAPRSG